MKSQRIVYPDILRILASFLVVVVHVTSVGIRDYEIGSLTWRSSLAINSVCHWAVPVFFMISGMMFLDPDREVTTRKIFTKNIPKILLCVIIWGFFYSLLDQYIYGDISVKSMLIAIYGIVTDNTGYHLWFLYTLLALYIATPTLRILTANATKRQLEYALGVWFVFSVCVGQVNDLAAHFLKMEDVLPYEATVIAGFAGYYLLGYYLKKYPVPKKWIPMLYALALLFLVVMPLADVIMSEIMNVKNIPAIMSQLGVGNFFVAVGAFVFASRIRTERYSEKLTNGIRWFGERTFGIYLTHVFFVSIIFRILNRDILACCPPAIILAVSALIFAVSAMSAWFLSKMPLLKQIV